MNLLANNVAWNDTPWAALESLHESVQCDVCVVGLGGSGLQAVAQLLAHGMNVVGIDAGMVGSGAAGSNGGFILGGIAAFHHDAVAALGQSLATQLYHETLHEITLLATQEPTFRQTGSIRIATDADEYADCATQYQRMRADGIAVEWYQGNEGRGLYFPHDGVFQPLARVRRMAQATLVAGARLYERTPATLITPGIVCANGYQIHCTHIVVAVDGKLEQLLPKLAQHVRTTRLQMIATAPDYTRQIPHPVYYRYGYDYWQQLPDARIVIGGSRDRYADHEWGFDANPTPAVQQSIEDTLRTVVGSNAPITHRWGASVAYRTDDIRPIVAQIDQNVWVCGAYNGTGNVVGTRCARHIATAIVTQRTDHMQAWISE